MEPGPEPGPSMEPQPTGRLAEGMWPALPRFALLLGLGGLLPFAAAALAAWSGPGWCGPGLQALRAYGACILAFLGAVHWGFALRDAAAAATDWRLGLGVLPALIAWAALLLPEQIGLPVLALAILGTAGIESWAARHDWVPRGYLALRWALSLGAAAALLASTLVSWSGTC